VGDAGSGGIEDSRSGSAGVVEKMGLTSGPPVSVVCREKASRTEGVNQRRKCTSTITPMTRVGRAAWAGLWASACGRREASGGRLGQRPSGPVRVAGPKVKKKDFLIRNWILEFTKALEICTRKIRRNFDMGIFLKFF
jgi:hypothetical protein